MVGRPDPGAGGVLDGTDVVPVAAPVHDAVLWGGFQGPSGCRAGPACLASAALEGVPVSKPPRRPSPHAPPALRAAHRVRRGPLLGGGIIRVLPDVELVRRQEVDVWLLEALEDGPWDGQSPHLSATARSPGLPPPPGVPPGRAAALAASPLFISRVSWSRCSSSCTRAPGSRFRMASTAARPPLRRKLKSPNQKTPSKREVTSAGA